MKLIKILHVVAWMDPTQGGVCQAVRLMIDGLANNGIQSEVVSLDDDRESVFTKDTFVAYALGPGIGPWCYSSALYPWLVDNCSRYDLIITHGLWLYHTYAVKKALKVVKDRLESEGSRPPKSFIMPHGMLDPYFQHAKGREIKAIRNWVYWKFIENQVIRVADGLLFTSLEERRLARLTFRPYHPKKESVVGMGLTEPPAYSQAMQEAFLQKCPKVRNKSYILFLGRIDVKKGIDLLIKALDEIETAHHLVDYEAKDLSEVCLVIAGPGLETAFGKKIKRLVAESKKLHSLVYFPGMISGNAKWGAIYGCDAFVLPSHQENFGIAVVEALACARPVLISNRINIWREIEAKGGALVAEDTVQGTKENIERWCKLSDSLKEDMKRKARLTYIQDYAIDSSIKKLIITLKEVL